MRSSLVYTDSQIEKVYMLLVLLSSLLTSVLSHEPGQWPQPSNGKYRTRFRYQLTDCDPMYCAADGQVRTELSYRLRY